MPVTETFSVNGTVQDENGKVPNCPVAAMTPAGDPVGDGVFTDENGGFTISNLINGDYVIKAEKDGKINSTLIQINGANIENLILVIQRI